MAEEQGAQQVWRSTLSAPPGTSSWNFFFFIFLEWEQQRQYKYHHNTHDNLQRQTYLDVIHEGILTGRHHECIRRSRERRSKAHAGCYRYCKEERSRINTNLYRTIHGNRCQKYRCSRIADKHRHQRSGEIDTSHQSERTVHRHRLSLCQVRLCDVARLPVWWYGAYGGYAL